MERFLSIIVIDYVNQEELCQTLDSLIEQDYINKEIIIMGRSHNKESLELLEKKYENIPYMRYASVPEETPLVMLINMGSEISIGEYLCFVNAGTLCKPNRFSKQIELLEANKNSLWNYCIAFDKYNRTKVFPPLNWPFYKKSGNIFPDVISDCCIVLDSIIVQKNLFYEMGGMEESLIVGYEKDFLLRLLTKTSASFCNEVLVQAKIKEDNIKESLISEIYFLSQFAEELKKCGMKENVFTKVLSFIEEQRLLYQFETYLEILKADSDYSQYITQYLEQKNRTRILKKSTQKDISGVQNCVGCSSCYHHCPVNAISMVINQEGFITPEINAKKCIKCGRCLQVCPTQIDINSTKLPQICYAAQAKDSIRMQSSSGGIFNLLANYFIGKQGYVVGAVYDNDLHVKHIAGNCEKDIQRMQTSKYVQSDITDVLPVIKEKLEKNIPVLFTGCVCQVAAVKAYLSKKYENLYTIDVVCHGIPSIKAYRQYLYDLQKAGGSIEEINFRKKSALGWKTGGYAKYKSGKEYIARTQDSFLMGFLQNWYLRESCYTCEFKDKKYSDITLGDFWGIQQLVPDFEDGKGTSYISINTGKGFELYKGIQSNIEKMKTLKNESAIVYNPSIKFASERPKMRDIFFKVGTYKSLSKNISRALYYQHFDIGLVLWWSSNHGNAITNYALYKLLEKEYKVLAIDSGPLSPQKRFRKFAKENYICSSDFYPKGALSIIDKCCDKLIVGSDQTWNVHFEKMLKCGNYYQLDFASENTSKISYAASFGMKSAEPKGEEYVKLYQRFDYISVREEFGVAVCKEEYGVNATLVLDPVFLLEEQEYDELIDKTKIEENEPYICAYLLNPTKEKRDACNAIRNQMGGIKIINLTEGDAGLRDDIRHILEFENIKLNVTVEEWLYYLKNSQYVITDSFHGTCFSIIFKKNFMAFVNRQPDRFKVFERFGNASEHIEKEYTDKFLNVCLSPIDYKTIDMALTLEREKSKTWLNTALKTSINKK